MRMLLPVVASFGSLMPLHCEPPRPSSVALGAITADGVAVYIPARGEPVELLHDGPTTARLHSVEVTSDGERAWVTECCEPVWGQWWEVEVGGGPVDPYGRPGYAFELDPSETLIASLGYFAVAVRDLTGETVAQVDLADRDPYDVTWIGPDRLAVLELITTDHGVEFRLVTTARDLAGYADAIGTLIGQGLDEPWPRLAGVDGDGNVLVARADQQVPTDVLEAYDPVTHERVPGADIDLPGRATSAWVGDGRVVWVDHRQRLHVDGDRVRGRYTWARPVG